MPLTAEQLKQQVLIDVGDTNNSLLTDIGRLWTKNDGRDIWGQYLFTRLDAITLLIARARNLVQSSADGRTLYNHQVFNHLMTLRSVFLSELSSYLSAESMAGAEVGMMEAYVPVEGVTGFPDPNDQIYVGSPVARQLPLALVPNDLP